MHFKAAIEKTFECFSHFRFLFVDENLYSLFLAIFNNFFTEEYNPEVGKMEKTVFHLISDGANKSLIFCPSLDLASAHNFHMYVCYKIQCSSEH